jgi:hypothetical protein
MAKAKKEKGHIIMKVYDDYSATFEIDGDDNWLAAGIASGLEDNRLSTIIVVAAQTLLETRQEKQELDIYFEPEAKPVKKAAKKVAKK